MEEGARLRCCPAAKAVSERKNPRRCFENTHHLTSRCLVVLRQSRRRLEVKSSGLAKRALILTVFCTFRGGERGRKALSALPVVLVVLVGHVLSLSPRVKISSATGTHGSSSRRLLSERCRLFVQTAKTLSVYDILRQRGQRSCYSLACCVLPRDGMLQLKLNS